MPSFSYSPFLSRPTTLERSSSSGDFDPTPSSAAPFWIQSRFDLFPPSNAPIFPALFLRPSKSFFI
jgi:hypothetical protein